MNKLIVLDRDGVINFDSPDFIKSPEEWIPIPHALESIVKLKKLGFKIAIATNQSGIAKGILSLETLNLIHDKMLKELKTLGGDIDKIYFCPHSEGCFCRKPSPGMLVQACKDFNVKPQNLIMVGDRISDLEAVQSIGGKGYLLHPPMFKNLSEFVLFIESTTQNQYKQISV